MRKMDDFVSTILTSELPEETKVTYLRNLNVVERLSERQIVELEDKIYEMDHKRLSEKDKITYEANFLYAYYKKNNLDLTDIRRLYYNISRASSNADDINNVKMFITQLQLDNGLSIRFYKSYLDLLEKMKKENSRKPQRTFHK